MAAEVGWVGLVSFLFLDSCANVVVVVACLLLLLLLFVQVLLLNRSWH
jgi:hypothetical protein